MQFKVQIAINDEQGDTITEDIFTIDKLADGDDLVGLSLAEAKRLLKRLQQVICDQQAHQYSKAHRCCPHCSKKRRIKGKYDIQYRTLFGIVSIPNTRFYHCPCEESK